MEYIDAEKLIAEIERLNSLVSYESKDRHDEGLHDAYKAVKNIIYSLQQEHSEVDLEKIIGQTYHDGSVADTSDMDHVDYENIARHFYELGLNARK